MSISFNGVSKIIKLEQGVTTVSVETIYSRWKEWMLAGDNIKYLQAFRYVGGDPTVSGQRLGTTYFLTNGWRIEPFSGDHVLVVEGNLFTNEADNPFVKPAGNYSILIQNQFSNLSTVVETSGNGSGTTVDATAIAREIWNTNISSTPFTQTGSIGNYIVSKLLTVAKFIGLS